MVHSIPADTLLEAPVSPAEDALSLLHATACKIDEKGGLLWVDPVKAALFLQVDRPPSHFDELDLAVEGAAFQALRRGHPVTIRRPSKCCQPDYRFPRDHGPATRVCAAHATCGK